MMLSFDFSPLISSVRIGLISGADLAAVLRAEIAMEVLTGATCYLAKTLVLTLRIVANCNMLFKFFLLFW